MFTLLSRFIIELQGVSAPLIINVNWCWTIYTWYLFSRCR